MRHTLLILILLISLSLAAELNRMRIIGVAERQLNAIVPVHYQTVNRERAACIIFVTDLAVDLDFRPRVELVALTNPASGQHNVYVAPGERAITVHAAGYAPLNVVLRDFGISVLRSGDVYELQLTGDEPRRRDDVDLFTLLFDIQPEDVYISRNRGAPIPVRGNSARFRLAGGTHRFTFIKEGYKEEDIELEVDDNISRTISLQRGEARTTFQMPGVVAIETEPAGAELYLNEQLVGVTPYMGQLIAGEYDYSLRLPLYNTEQGIFSLNERETLNLPKIYLQPRFGTINIRSNPQGAEVRLNEQLRGETPIERLRLDSGEYDIEIRHSLYHSYTENFILQDGESKNLDVRLKPAYGELIIESSPEQGAVVYIDDRMVGTTPYRNNRQPSGRYIVRLEKDLYSAATREIIVPDEKTVREDISLSPNFGTLTVISEKAEIFLNDKSVGRDRYSERLAPGRYSLTAKKDRHHDASQDIFLQVGERREIKLETEPRLGAVSIISLPIETRGSAITVNDERREETSPAVVPLLIGDYRISLNQRGFLEQTRPVTILEGQTANLEFTMQTYRGSMQAKRDFWRTNKWIALTGTAIAIGGAVYFDIQADKYLDNYRNPSSPQEELNNWENANKAVDNRDMMIYISIAPAAYTIFSWIREATYSGRIR